MAKFGMCSIVEAGKLPYHKALVYQSIVLDDIKGISNNDSK